MCLYTHQLCIYANFLFFFGIFKSFLHYQLLFLCRFPAIIMISVQLIQLSATPTNCQKNFNLHDDNHPNDRHIQLTKEKEDTLLVYATVTSSYGLVVAVTNSLYNWTCPRLQTGNKKTQQSIFFHIQNEPVYLSPF